MTHEISSQYRRATEEKIARYTVGIAVERNTGIGTGTLVLVGEDRFVLTAAHVIEGSNPAEIRFWLRPPKPMVEKAAADTQNSEIGGFTLGEQLPIADIWFDPKNDVAAIKLDAAFALPEAAELYDTRRSYEFMSWEDKKLDGLSLVLFGFPIANSREVFIESNRSFRFLGCATHLSEYSLDLNKTAWSGLSSKYSPSKDFVFKYHGSDDLTPQGFSGGGVWVLAESPERAVWRPEPILIGLVHHYAPKAGLLIASKLPAFVEVQIGPPAALSS